MTCGGGKSIYTFSAAENYEGNIDNVSAVSTYVNEPDETTKNETVAWSQVRHTGYCLLVGEVTPPGHGGQTTLSIRGVNQAGTEVDRFTLSRLSGR